MVGDEDGSVNVYQLKKMNATPENQVTHMNIKFLVEPLLKKIFMINFTS